MGKRMSRSKKEYQACEALWAVKSNLCMELVTAYGAWGTVWQHPQFLAPFLLLCCFPILLGFKFLRVGNSKA